jgi:predicted nucleic-acid-binding protein
MIGLDTNILVRVVTNDDPSQKKRVDRLLKEKCTSTDPGFITIVTIVELVWILQSHYNYAKDQIILVINSLLSAKDLLIEHEKSVLFALEKFSKNTCDFPDILIGEICKTNQCSTAMTFDKKASQLETFTLV